MGLQSIWVFSLATSTVIQSDSSFPWLPIRYITRSALLKMFGWCGVLCVHDWRWGRFLIGGGKVGNNLCWCKRHAQIWCICVPVQLRSGFLTIPVPGLISRAVFNKIGGTESRCSCVHFPFRQFCWLNPAQLVPDWFVLALHMWSGLLVVTAENKYGLNRVTPPFLKLSTPSVSSCLADENRLFPFQGSARTFR